MMSAVTVMVPDWVQIVIDSVGEKQLGYVIVKRKQGLMN
jgi:hypothetical protein